MAGRFDFARDFEERLLKHLRTYIYPDYTIDMIKKHKEYRDPITAVRSCDPQDIAKGAMVIEGLISFAIDESHEQFTDAKNLATSYMAALADKCSCKPKGD